jgi:hypothetical protein
MPNLTREQILQQDAALRVYQARADSALEPWGVRAPPPVMSDDPRYPEQYRRKLAYLAKKRLPEDHELRTFQVKHIPLDVLETVEPQIFRACRDSAHRPDSVPPGQMRRVEQTDQNGLKIVSWIGAESFVKELGRPGRRVVSFRIDQGFVDASGRALR